MALLLFFLITSELTYVITAMGKMIDLKSEEWDILFFLFLPLRYFPYWKKIIKKNI